MGVSDHADFVRANTAIGSAPLVPEINLHLASEVTPLWHATEASLAQSQLPPPYWGFAWPGGQALARYILDRPETVRGKTLLDLGAGSGIAAIAAALAGAAQVTAAEIDPFAAAAIELNAALNGIATSAQPSGNFRIHTGDILSTEPQPHAIILAGDMAYEKPLADRLFPWLLARAAARAGPGAGLEKSSIVLLGDPGRAYLPTSGLERLASYIVPTSLDLEDRATRETSVWCLI
jgi:predicted nicotinamide N-methyase